MVPRPTKEQGHGSLCSLGQLTGLMCGAWRDSLNQTVLRGPCFCFLVEGVALPQSPEAVVLHVETGEKEL
jgi:hypothetical protein